MDISFDNSTDDDYQYQSTSPTEQGIFNLELEEKQKMGMMRVTNVQKELTDIPSFHESRSLPSNDSSYLRFSPDTRGYTPLHYVSAMGKKETTNVLLKDRRVQVDAREPREGLTPLMLAVLGGQIDLAKQLVQQGANPNLKDFNGRTPLYMSTQGNSLDLVVLLIENGADPNLSDLEGVSPLHIAAAIGNSDIVGSLVQRGAWIDFRDNNGETPLFWAIREGHSNCVKTLAELGADVNIKDCDGESVIEFCKSIDDEQTYRYLSMIASSGNNSRNRSKSAKLVSSESYSFVCPESFDESMMSSGIANISLANQQKRQHSMSAPSSFCTDQNILNKWVVW